MSLSHLLAYVLCLLVALPGDMGTLVSRPNTLLIVTSADTFTAPSPILKKSLDRSKVLTDQEARCEFDEGTSLTNEPSGPPGLAQLASLDWWGPLLTIVSGDACLQTIRPISSRDHSPGPLRC